MKKALKIFSHIVLTLLFLGYIAYQFRTDPIETLSGRQVTGPELSYPVDWSLADDYQIIAIETRINYPHSVKVTCWRAQGGCMSQPEVAPARNGPLM